MTEKISLYNSLMAAKKLENAIEKDLFAIITKHDDSQEIVATISHMRNVTEDVMASFRAKLLKLEHDVNTIIEKREEAHASAE